MLNDSIKVGFLFSYMRKMNENIPYFILRLKISKII